MSKERDPRPFIVVTAILDGSARPAAITVSHADAMERAYGALADRDVAGMDIVELPVPPQAFTALRKHSGRDPDTVAVYDLFPLASSLEAPVRMVAGQFLAAEALWALEEQGHLDGIPLNLKIDVPHGWDRDPKALHDRLVGAGALDLTVQAIETFKQIKTAWDSNPATG